MIKDYLWERKSWMALFLFLELFILFVAYLDPTIPLSSILYIVFLTTIIFVVFVIIRWKKETAFYQRLQEWERGLDPVSALRAASPLEKIVERVLASQTDQWKQELKEHLATLEQEKDELLSWIHEMKTPLTAMRLIIERVGDENTKAQLLYEWLRIHLLLDQQLHQRRLPHMENDLYIEQVELEPLLINEIKPLQSWCMQKGIGFDLQLDVRSVLSDAKWLSFIIRQIITNAVKYSESSDIVVKSFMKNGHARLQIQDFGLGIDPKDLPRIFEKGFTSTTEHQNEAATGMGLYLAKKAAKPLLLDFHVESTPGRGTTFTIIFPQENDIIRTHRM
ncbi:sensor histidine kinase [Geobacillus zalihae]|jgi:OmpR family two-component system bacitracin resistance sensor histidine kinase BceS|uniref:histidine kinase n=1 Tax=Geobacillus zalihae TaxID=213419 RepID=A0A7H1RYZ8_9BACL|nr:MULTISPECIES: sensor histidine kinase [Geobacillus]OQP17325.1 ATP-binding protein [Geobacillus zalihae]OQP25067.1 ATP-binding protein [Geobacillus zalihae]QNU19487.1 sensor histidine kinase [Geobacillus zalihae]RXS89535.1 HAMP domain-containing histidine kinase [Geobacillus sp. PK12]WKA46390.1 sensor histidine kinase [Geobacillus zalihae]